MNESRVKVIAHRGASDQAPENTIAAFERALDLGYLVHANDALGRDEILRACTAGADSISTDEVALAMSLIRADQA